MDLLTRRRFGQVMVAGCASAATPLLFGASPSARALDGLGRSHPEAQGVDPRAVLAFLDEVSAAGLELHSFMLYRHGHVVAEGWWAPYRVDRPHMMHSLTKSVMVCGVGLALDEGRFGLDDKVVSFFDEELPPKIDDKLAAMTVRDLLTMRTGHAEETSGSVWRQITTSWVTEFFKIPIVYQPGTKFVYTSAASFMLSAIVTKTTGQKLRDYMEPRFFGPLGIRDLTWDIGPGGINPGGNGLTWTTADCLKLGAVHAQKGMWEGRQVLSRKWVEEATTPKIEDGRYGYQWWMGPDHAYYALGLFTQLSIVFPQHDAVLAITAAIDGSKKLLPIIWKHFPTAFGSSTSTAATRAGADLRARTSKLSLLPPLSASRSRMQAKVSGKVYNIEPNEDDVSSMRFDFTGNRCLFHLKDARGEHQVDVGLRDWIESDTSITGNKLHHQYQPDKLRVVAGGRWLEESVFEMTWQFVETAFRDRVVCRFDGDSMTFDRSVNVNSAATYLPTLHGRSA